MKRMRNSFWALLGRPTCEAPEVVLERVRLAMLFAMDEYCTQDHVKLDMAIRFANDLTELWYIRPDLMHAIASGRGEATAQRALRRITDLFLGHFSSANASRFASLQSASS